MNVAEVTAKARVLLEALPYIQDFRGSTFVVKYGGSVMDDPPLSSPRLQARVLRPGITALLPDAATTDTILRPAFERLDHAIDQFLEQARLVA